MMNRENTKGGSLFWPVTAAIMIFWSIFSQRSCGVNFSNGTGEKVGQIVKFSQQGWFNKTWEGQLIRGGMNGGSGAFGTVPFNFTIEDVNLANKVEQCMRDQTEVVVHYRIEGIYSPFRSESQGHFLASIEPAKK